MFRDLKYIALRFQKAFAACGDGYGVRCAFCKQWGPRESMYVNLNPRTGFQCHHRDCVAKYRRDERIDPTIGDRERARDRARGSNRPNRKQSIAAYNASAKRKGGYQRYYRTEKGRENYRRLDVRRRARKAVMEGSHTHREWAAVLYMNDYACVGCGRYDLPMTRDHIIPVSRNGTDYIENIQPMCKPCNSRKRDRMAA